MWVPPISATIHPDEVLAVSRSAPSKAVGLVLGERSCWARSKERCFLPGFLVETPKRVPANDTHVQEPQKLRARSCPMMLPLFTKVPPRRGSHGVGLKLQTWEETKGSSQNSRTVDGQHIACVGFHPPYEYWDKTNSMNTGRMKHANFSMSPSR